MLGNCSELQKLSFEQLFPVSFKLRFELVVLKVFGRLLLISPYQLYAELFRVIWTKISIDQSHRFELKWASSMVHMIDDGADALLHILVDLLFIGRNTSTLIWSVCIYIFVHEGPLDKPSALINLWLSAFLHALVTNAVVHFYHQLVGNFPRSCWRTRIWQESLANYENISKILFNFRVTQSVNLFKSPKNCKRSWTIKRGKMHKRIYNDYTSAKNLNLKTNLLEPLKSHMETSKLSNQSWNSHETDKNPPKLSRMPIRMNEISRPDSQWSSVLWFKNCKIVCDVTEFNITSKLCEHLSIRL